MYNIVILDCILHYFNKFAYLKVHVYEVILLLSKKKEALIHIIYSTPIELII